MSELRGLIVDWGGVLTAPLDNAMADWARRDGVDFEHFRDVLREWLGPPPATGGAGEAGGDTGAVGTPSAIPPPDAAKGVVAELEMAADTGPAGQSPVHRLERGEITPEEFERELAQALGRRGSAINQDGLLSRVLGGLTTLSDDMLALVRRARAAGLRTALLSNSWGDDSYPEHAWDGAFDAVVISGRVGMRKPDPEIYQHTAKLLGLEPASCVMVDDLPVNIRGAVAVGMVGVLHSSVEETAHELEILFDLRLAGH